MSFSRPLQRFNTIDDELCENRDLVSILPATEAAHKAAVEEVFAEEERAQAAARAESRRGRLPTKRKKRWRR